MRQVEVTEVNLAPHSAFSHTLQWSRFCECQTEGGFRHLSRLALGQCPWHWGCTNAPSTSIRKQVAFIYYHPPSPASQRSPHAQPPQFVPCKNRGGTEWTLLQGVEAKLNSD